MPCEVRLSRRDNSVGWGFQLTGGVTFNMPLTIYEVQEGGEANRAGLRVGDVILKVNGMATNKLALKEANALLGSEDSVDLTVTNLQDQEAAELEAKMMTDEDEEFEAQRGDVNLLNLSPPRPAPRPETAIRKCWHPVVLDTNPPPLIEEATGDEEAPHKKILRNFRQAMAQKSLDPSPEKPPKIKPPQPPPDEEIAVPIMPEEMPEAELSMEEQLRSMQRQLAALCALPAALQKSLTAVSERIYRLLPPEQEPEPEPEAESEPVSEVVENDEEYEDLSVAEPNSEREQITEEVEVESEEEIEPEPESEPESEPELTVEEMERIEKLRKMEELNRAWPWGDEIKPVYKISDRYKVPHSKVFNKKIQSIESKMTLRKLPSETEE
ncbi:uncharacterized protein LOC143912535 isoform X2 [Arctopsyche grandis]|uniref:uncharacterized protein LOC143912535 isoform X2 n=1 Tax=Arctopsyche grandis TaxID=121162 RepID=UPI00406D86E6